MKIDRCSLSLHAITKAEPYRSAQINRPGTAMSLNNDEVSIQTLMLVITFLSVAFIMIDAIICFYSRSLSEHDFMNYSRLKQ